MATEEKQYPMLSVHPKNDFVVYADADGDISCIEWEGHIVNNLDTVPGEKVKELLRFPPIAALSGITYGINSGKLNYLYIGSTSEVKPAAGNGAPKDIYHLGKLESLINGLRVEYKDGKLIGLTVEKTFGVIPVDQSGFSRFDEVIKRNETKIANSRTKFSVLEDRRKEVQKDIDQLNSSNPKTELLDLEKFLKDTTEKVGGTYDSSDPTSGLSLKLQEHISSSTEQRELAQSTLNRWRNYVSLPASDYSQQAIDETSKVTQDLIEVYKEKLRKQEADSSEIRSKIFSIRNDISSVCKSLTGVDEVDPNSAMSNIRAYTHAVELDRSYNVKGSRSSWALEVLGKIKKASGSKIVDDPKEVEKYRKQFSALSLECDTKRKLLQLQIDAEKNRVSG
jgi:hypothetical protein